MNLENNLGGSFMKFLWKFSLTIIVCLGVVGLNIWFVGNLNLPSFISGVLVTGIIHGINVLYGE